MLWSSWMRVPSICRGTEDLRTRWGKSINDLFKEVFA